MKEMEAADQVSEPGSSTLPMNESHFMATASKTVNTRSFQFRQPRL
jgi:hypothetical protein